MMNLTDTIEVLKRHAHWRKCNDDSCKCAPTEPNLLSEALESAISTLEIIDVMGGEA